MFVCYRKDNSGVRYLDASITSKAEMYRLYNTWLQIEYPNDDPVTLHYYEDCLKKYFKDLKITKPKSDTCKICDKIFLDIKDTRFSLQERRKMQIKLELHQCKAARGYALPKEIIAFVGDDTMVICLDLQQALVTPKLPTNIVFYKRKEWTYNFGIHDYKTGLGYMYMWDEVTANRGAIEIASFIYKFITQQMPPTIRKLYVFSDNCAGQNKNYIFILFYIFLLHRRHLEEVNHVFFQTGHTYMAADGDFACIEKAIRKQMYIYSPMDYADIIRNARRRNARFQVAMMTQADFYDFEQLKSRCTLRKPNRIKFSEACYYKIKKDFNGYELAANYGVGERQLALGEKVCWTKGVQRSDQTLNASFNLNVPLKRKYNAPLPLTQLKLLDLKTSFLT